MRRIPVVPLVPLVLLSAFLLVPLAPPTLPAVTHAADPAAEATTAPSAAPSAARAPVDGSVLRLFDPPSTRYGRGHRGVDLAASPGQPVRAALSGEVTFSGEVAGRGWVTVAHGAGLDTTYGWIDPREVERGDRVSTGEVLGRLAPEAGHLDWGARLAGEYIDPLSLLGPWEAHLVPLADPG